MGDQEWIKQQYAAISKRLDTQGITCVRRLAKSAVLLRGERRVGWLMLRLPPTKVTRPYRLTPRYYRSNTRCYGSVDTLVAAIEKHCE